MKIIKTVTAGTKIVCTRGGVFNKKNFQIYYNFIYIYITCIIFKSISGARVPV